MTNHPSVLSVPHSGSRTLLKELGFPRWDLAVQNGFLLHFGPDNAKIKALGRVEVHIPIRNPIDTMCSWRARNLSMDRTIQCFKSLVAYSNPAARYYVVENLAGKVGEHPKQDPVWVVQALERWEDVPHEVKEFYRGYGYEV